MHLSVFVKTEGTEGRQGVDLDLDPLYIQFSILSLVIIVGPYFRFCAIEVFWDPLVAQFRSKLRGGLEELLFSNGTKFYLGTETQREG